MQENICLDVKKSAHSSLSWIWSEHGVYLLKIKTIGFRCSWCKFLAPEWHLPSVMRIYGLRIYQNRKVASSQAGDRTTEGYLLLLLLLLGHEQTYRLLFVKTKPGAWFYTDHELCKEALFHMSWPEPLSCCLFRSSAAVGAYFRKRKQWAVRICKILTTDWSRRDASVWKSKISTAELEKRERQKHATFSLQRDPHPDGAQPWQVCSRWNWCTTM